MKLVFNRLLAGLVLLSLTAFSTAHAQNGYFGVSYAALDTEIASSVSWSTPAVVLKGGYQFNDNLAIEGRVGVGVGDDTTASVTVEVDNLLGVYLRPGVNLGRWVHLYGMLGFTRGEITFSGAGGAIPIDDTDVSYGVGLEFGSKFGGSIEYMNYYDEAGDTIDGFAIGIQFKF